MPQRISNPRPLHQRLRENISMPRSRLDLLQHLISVVLQRSLSLLKQRNIRLLSTLHVGHGVKFHNPISKRTDLPHEVLLSLLITASSIISPYVLDINQLNKEDEHVFELLLHDCLDIEHIISVSFV